MKQVTDTNAIEIKVLYVRLISSDPTPTAITVVFHSGEVENSLTVNGKAAAAAAPAVLLRRARADVAAGENDYVSTDCVRFAGGLLGFEIKVEGERGALVAGLVKRTRDRGWGWVMQCGDDGGGGGLRFLVDVYLVGRSTGRAVLLSRVVRMRKSRKELELDCYVGSKLEEGIMREQSCERLSKYHIKNGDEHKRVVGSEEELGELSWFSEGVRVGMGLGFAMCLGAGVGMSLVMRTYQAAAGALKRFI